MESGIYGKNAKKQGKAPAVVLVNPKFPHNVGAIVRSASCWGIGQVWWTGNRIKLDSKTRLPREERMKGYKDVELRQFDNPFDQFDLSKVTPVAIELQRGAESLPTFDHPKNAVYVFGPEDGSINPTFKKYCHRFVVIPTKHCLNLSVAVSIVLYERQRQLNPTVTIYETLDESRKNMFLNNDRFVEELGLTSKWTHA
ncbi:MAG TPA: TrmH family RNA methyltransferase [Candidatus Glassbacteria bacterium]|nr:TrmH family RNA methyltransferase [Candidatus Glassbacteria bacterium]